ncbi:Transmembrane protein 231 [Durusdinium trenchii]|uniref:Transmembrane protein 231 n=1 Tax=Durusdinium trenchii TaxID=1381693 RepID=A0ABP0HTM6_9DINO
MVVTVFQEPIVRKYRAPLCSLACLFNLVVVVAALVVPFYVAYASQNFWLKTNTFLEQPVINFQYDVLVVLQGTAAQDSQVATWAWSTTAGGQEAYENYLRAPIIRAWAEDDNLDEVADTWTVTVQMPLEATERVYQAQALLYFGYSLQGPAQLDMDAIAYVEHASPLPGTELLVEADAALRQRTPLSVRRANTHPSLRFGEASPSMFPNKISTVLSSYAKRNYTMALENTYKSWGVSSVLDPNSIVADSFCLNFTMRVPRDTVLYTPGVPEVLKTAWIQFFAIFVLFAVLLAVLQSFVFTNQVLESVVAAEGPMPHTKRKEHRF